MLRIRPLAASLPLLLAGSCLGQTTVTGPQLVGEGRKVLFIGNSYLYYVSIAGVVQALADSAGADKLAVETVAYPDAALIDHWQGGVARSEIAEGGWEWVVLQQGPSSVELNRDTLRLATQYFASVISPIGARPALFSAWPSEARRQDFPRAIESYTLAAADVGGILLPVAAAWLAAWDRDPNLQLYSDGLHESGAGAYLSALVVYGGLLNRSPRGLPATLRLRDGSLLQIPAATALLLQDAAAQALQAVSR